MVISNPVFRGTLRLVTPDPKQCSYEWIHYYKDTVLLKEDVAVYCISILYSPTMENPTKPHPIVIGLLFGYVASMFILGLLGLAHTL